MNTKPHDQIETMVEVIEGELAAWPEEMEASGQSEATQLKAILQAVDQLDVLLLTYLHEYPQAPIRKAAVRMEALVALMQCEIWTAVDGYHTDRSNAEWEALHPELWMKREEWRGGDC